MCLEVVENLLIIDYEAEKTPVPSTDGWFLVKSVLEIRRQEARSAMSMLLMYKRGMMQYVCKCLKDRIRDEENGY